MPYRETQRTRLASDDLFLIHCDPPAINAVGISSVGKNLMIENAESYDRFDTLDACELKTTDDPVHAENDTIDEGKPLVKAKYRATIDSADNDRDVQSDPDAEDRNFDSFDRESNDESNANPPLPRVTKDEVAKQQMKDGLKVALASFELPKPPKEAANDNYRPVISWPLMDQLTRSTFDPNRERRSKYAVTARYIRELIDLVEADPSGADLDVQRSSSGSVHFEHGQTLDRKKRTYDCKNGEPNARRHDGPVRIAKKAIPVGNNMDRNDPFALRAIAAGQELDAIRQYIGSALWPLLIDAISENASMTDIGLKLGARGGQAPPVGSAIIRLALSSAIDALATLNWLRDDMVRPTPLPDKSRGSYFNQARGPVFKVAA